MAIEFAPGQIWTVRARVHEPDARALILAVETRAPLGVVCSIALTGIAVANPLTVGGVQRELVHAPVTADVLADVVVRLVGTDGPDATHPTHAEAYQQWHEAFADAAAGVFTIPIADLLEVLEQAVAQSGVPKN